MKKQQLFLAGLTLSASLGLASFNVNPVNAAGGSILVGGEELYVDSGEKSNTAGTATYIADNGMFYDRPSNKLILNNYDGGPYKD